MKQIQPNGETLVLRLQTGTVKPPYLGAIYEITVRQIGVGEEMPFKLAPPQV